jgi:hypothetical protein
MPILSALEAQGLVVLPVLYEDATADALVQTLASFDAVLVWVDPISGDGNRAVLDQVLSEVARRGTWVSAHPDTIMKMGTKEVLYTTRHLSWGGDTRIYETADDLRRHLPQSLAEGRVRVLKQSRGNGGIGVWKIALIDPDAAIARVQEAAPRDDSSEDLPLSEFIDRCALFFTGGGMLVDQSFSERLPEGLIRAYLVENEVVGFARQRPASQTDDPAAPSATRVLGLPSAKTMYGPHEPEFSSLRAQLEDDWVAALCRQVGLDDEDLPVLWDADFLFGPRREDGRDTYLLCEINVSSVIPFPPQVPAKLARAVRHRLRGAY